LRCLGSPGREERGNAARFRDGSKAFSIACFASFARREFGAAASRSLARFLSTSSHSRLLLLSPATNQPTPPPPLQARRAAVSAVTVASGEPTGPVLRKPEAGGSTSSSGAPSTSGSSPSSPSSSSSSNVTIEFQRSQAKAMQAYFKALKADQVAKDNQRFGWTRKNEILNGRHVMGGIFVGLLTEYSTGVNFIDQLKLTVSLLGIADIYD
jgi:hypothetical protein